MMNEPELTHQIKHWAITTRIGADGYWRAARQAIICHRTQWAGYGALERFLTEQHQALLGTQAYYYRAFSLVNGGCTVESDLFEGVRAA